MLVRERIERSYVVTENGCWEWTKGRSNFGHGKIGLKQNGENHTLPVHRVYYQLVKGFIKDGSVLDHLCNNSPCINPDHLEPVTQWENNARGIGVTADNIRKTKCVNGHEFTPQNTGRYAKTGWRYCRTCSRARTNYGLQQRTLRNNALGLNSKGKPFKTTRDKKRSQAWGKKREESGG